MNKRESNTLLVIDIGKWISSQATRKSWLIKEGDTFGESKKHHGSHQCEKEPFVMVIKLHITELQPFAALPRLSLPPSASFQRQEQ